jgi:hypothetical protein
LSAKIAADTLALKFKTKVPATIPFYSLPFLFFVFKLLRTNFIFAPLSGVFIQVESAPDL